jgi:hypothetical protein
VSDSLLPWHEPAIVSENSLLVEFVDKYFILLKRKAFDINGQSCCWSFCVCISICLPFQSNSTKATSEGAVDCAAAAAAAAATAFPANCRKSMFSRGRRADEEEDEG